MNTLLSLSKLRYEAVDYNNININDFLPALKEAINIAKENYAQIKAENNPSFTTIIEKGEQAGEFIDYISGIYYALYSADCTDEIQAISEEFSSLITKFYNDINLDPKLFTQVKTVYDNQANENLTTEQKQVLEKAYKSFVRNGALLNENDKQILRSIDEEMAKLELVFTENVRKATQAFFLTITDEKDVKGMPEAVLEAAKEEAKKKGVENGWVFTLDFPSYLPFMQNCQNRALRKKMSDAAGAKAFGGDFDNTKNIKRMLELKEKRAKLLGYKNHAYYILENRMAETPEKVMSFLNELHDKAAPAAKKDLQKLIALKKEMTGDTDFQRYDSAFYTELLKKKELNIDDEILRPYFKLENVIQGVFDIANRLYDINFKEVHDLPKYHPDVKTYEVFNTDGSFIGLFYADFFPRATKRPGAWMTDIRGQGLMFGKISHPIISIVCNFTKPTASRPSLLTLDEVLTLFHEFGHALHGLLSKCTYRSVAGTNVYWDFVELPSQVMENWVSEKECLDLFAVHYETGEKIPEIYIQKIKEGQNFLEGLGTLRQLSFGYLDMALHSRAASEITDIGKFEDDIMKDYDPYPRDGKSNMLCSFGHIFPHGGYSAGYYSYKWAEVLDADAFESFKEKGIFDKETALAFKEHVLSKGGSEHPMELYKKFRGQEPKVESLLKRAGLL
jgi:Zn-dependent oligopeptidase